MNIQFKNAINKFNTLILSELHSQQIVCWVAGGSLRDYFMGVSGKTDIDIFFPNEVMRNKALTYLKDKGAKVVWESNNGAKVVYNNTTFDIISHYFDSPAATIDKFDFTVSMFATDGETIVHGETSFIDLAKRQLMIHHIEFPRSTMYRVVKYTRKGFYICKEQFLRVLDAVENAPRGERIVNLLGDNVDSGITTDQPSSVLWGYD